MRVYNKLSALSLMHQCAYEKIRKPLSLRLRYCNSSRKNPFTRIAARELLSQSVATRATLYSNEQRE